MRLIQVVKIMIINSYVQALNSVYATNAASNVKRASRPERMEEKDQVVLSGEAQSFRDMLQELHSQDEVRPDKVAAYTAQIEAGSYHVSSANIAASLFSNRF